MKQDVLPARSPEPPRLPDSNILPALARSPEPPRPESTGKPILGTVQAKKESVIVLPLFRSRSQLSLSFPVVCVCVCVCVCALLLVVKQIH